MDEPFGALDAMTRDVLHEELDALVSDRRLTVLFVTHNVREAARLGDRIVRHVAAPGPRHRRASTSTSSGRGASTQPAVSALAAEVTDRLREEVLVHARA